MPNNNENKQNDKMNRDQGNKQADQTNRNQTQQPGTKERADTGNRPTR